VEKLSPYHPPPIHVVAADLIKSIIVLNAPNSSQVTDGFQSPSSNQFATELAAETNVRKLLAFILDQDNKDTGSTSTANGLPDQQSRTSSRVTSTNILLELIRKNNSDDSESYLFHTLRNRLIQVQQSFDGLSSENPRATLERAMTDMTEKNGVVQLRNLLSIASERLEDLKNILTRMPIPKV
jgi:serine/threonine-protein phosphatase 6 regulatory subunit 3